MMTRSGGAALDRRRAPRRRRPPRSTSNSGCSASCSASAWRRSASSSTIRICRVWAMGSESLAESRLGQYSGFRPSAASEGARMPAKCRLRRAVHRSRSRFARAAYVGHMCWRAQPTEADDVGRGFERGSSLSTVSASARGRTRRRRRRSARSAAAASSRRPAAARLDAAACRPRETILQAVYTTSGATGARPRRGGARRRRSACRRPMSRRCSTSPIAPTARWPPRRRPRRTSSAPSRRSSAPTPRRASAGLRRAGRLSSSGWSPSGPTISASRSPRANIGRASAGAFEREAIRPYVLGRFADMLRGGRAASGDAEFSRQRAVGRPQFARPATAIASAASTRISAREILELHTMGVGSRLHARPTSPQLACILTGWTIVGREGKLGEPGAFAFNANAHEPRAGDAARPRSMSQDGVAQGEAALADLAREPATADHIASEIRAPFRRRRRPIRRWSRGSPRSFATPTAISARSPAR